MRMESVMLLGTLMSQCVAPVDPDKLDHEVSYDNVDVPAVEDSGGEAEVTHLNKIWYQRNITRMQKSVVPRLNKITQHQDVR